MAGKPPSCKRSGQTHQGPDGNDLCLACFRWVVWVECLGCRRDYLRAKYDYTPVVVCPDCETKTRQAKAATR